jgi:hypothetical protein
LGDAGVKYVRQKPWYQIFMFYEFPLFYHTASQYPVKANTTHVWALMRKDMCFHLKPNVVGGGHFMKADEMF